MKKAAHKNSVQVINLALQTDIPDYEHKAQGRNIKLFGPDNGYFEMVNRCYDVSPTNSCIVHNISEQVYGKGMYDGETEKNKKEVDALFPPEDVSRIISDFIKLGAACIQVGYTGKGSSRKISTTRHIPTDTIGMGMKNIKGEIKTYYYCADWSRSSYLKITPIPAFGTSEANLELLYVNTYNSGMHYFSKVDYHSALKYAKAEGEMADFVLNKISKGFSPTLLLNFNNGVPSPEEQSRLKRKIQQQYEGADGDNFIISFQEHQDQASSIKGVEQPDAFQQYHWVSTEATTKIVLAHRIVSEILVGIKNNMGLGNNSEEMKSSFQLHNATTIEPKQDKIIDAFQKILDVNGLDWDLTFKSLMPPSFLVDSQTREPFEKPAVSNNAAPTEESEPEELSSVECNHDDGFEQMLLSYSEAEPDGYDLEKIEFNISEPCDIEKLAATANSEQDTKRWKVRYAYSIGTSKTPEGDTRRFCSTMLSLARKGRVFRKEDIEKMSADGVNGEFAHTGGKYDIFLYGGGVNCYHRWERRIYKKKLNAQGNPMGGNAMQNTNPVSVNEARRQGFTPEKNDPDVAIAEITKPNKGSLKY